MWQCLPIYSKRGGWKRTELAKKDQYKESLVASCWCFFLGKKLIRVHDHGEIRVSDVCVRVRYVFVRGSNLPSWRRARVEGVCQLHCVGRFQDFLCRRHYRYVYIDWLLSINYFLFCSRFSISLISYFCSCLMI